MVPNALHKFFFTRDDAGLWSAQQFVAAKSDEGNPGFHALPDRRFVNSIRSQMDQASRTQIFNYRKSAAFAEFDQLLNRGLIGESGHLKIRGVNSQQQASLVGDRPFVVGNPGAIRSTDFTKYRAALRHHFRDSEAVPNFDE